MRSRIFFLAIVAFWLTMNALLWRSQFGSHSKIGNAVPLAVVWEKILSAPDSSSLDIYDHTNKIGLCHWVANVGNSPLASNKILEDDYAPDGAPPPVTGYSLALEGNATLSRSNRIRFEASLDLSTNRTWQHFHLRLNVRPLTYDIHATASSEKVALKVEDHGVIWDKTYKFSDLSDPEKILGDFGGSPVLGLLAGTGISPSKESLSALTSSMDLQAHEDTMKFGHSTARVYRLEAVFLGQRVYLFVSRVGEILWVELPGNITLRNETFEHF